MNKLKNTMTAALLAASSMLAIATTAQAGEAEDAVINKVINAYGGDKLTNLRSIRIQDTYKNHVPGQGYTSGYVEFTLLKQDAQLDLVNERGSIEGWSANWNFTFNTRTVTTGDDIVTINYNSGDYQPAAFADYYTAYGAAIRITDTLLAHQLSLRAESAEYQGEAIYLARRHEMLSFEMPSSPVVTLYVDSETGLISKMVRRTPAFGDLTYQFRNHTFSGGIAYAADFEFFVGDDVNILTLSRDVSFNAVRPSTFAVDRGVEQEPARVDTSETTVDEIAPGVHHVGTGFGYTTFVDAGDHVIAVGGYPGLNDRYAAYLEAAGHEKPLRYQIATHHHTDHLGGMGEAFALNATIVSPANAVANINAAVGEDVPENRLMILDEKTTLGPVEVYDIATSHAESYAAVYIPAAKAVFQADHYNGLYVDGPSPAGVGTVTFKKAIDDLGLDVETLLSAHGRKAVAWSEVEQAVAVYDPSPCVSGRPICRGVTTE